MCPHSCICISMHWFLCVCNGKVSFISLACSGAQSHLRNMGSHWSNTTVSFFFSRRTFKIGCQDSSPQHLAERSRKSLHCSGCCQWPIWISLSEQGLFKLFFSPHVLKNQLQRLGALNQLCHRANELSQSWKWHWQVEVCGAERTRMRTMKGVWAGMFNILLK